MTPKMLAVFLFYIPCACGGRLRIRGLFSDGTVITMCAQCRKAERAMTKREPEKLAKL